LDRQVENRQDEAWNLAGLGLVHLHRKDHDLAQPLLLQALAVNRELGFDFETASILVLLAVSVARAESSSEAKSYLLEAANLAGKLGSARLIDATYRGRAAVALSSGDPIRAAELLGAAESIRDMAQLSRSMFQRLFEEDLVRLRRELRPEELEEAWSAGRRDETAAI